MRRNDVPIIEVKQSEPDLHMKHQRIGKLNMIQTVVCKKIPIPSPGDTTSQFSHHTLITPSPPLNTQMPPPLNDHYEFEGAFQIEVKK